ncbi:MAG: hypothetical protein KF830_16240 [Planctomycetes bacterium]|nr:hypothetical protein [Planctomycetota bacterium]
MSRGVAKALVAWLAAAIPAQERSVVHQIDGREVVVVRAVPYAGAGVAGGFGFVAVEAENRDASAHDLVVEVQSLPGASGRIAVRRELRLDAHELGRWFLPLPTPGVSSLRFDVVVDGVRTPGSIAGGRGDGLVGLTVVARSDSEPWGLTVLQAMRRQEKEAARVVAAPPGDLPADWRLYTGFHAVVVDGRAALAADVQAALVQFAAAGGTVVVGDAERLPPGVLRDRAGAAAGGGMRLGLGHLVPAAVGGDSTALRARLADLPPPSIAGWPLPADLLAPQAVPGLGEPPVLAFLVVVLLFAVVVGPVNFLLLRRLRRPLLLLLTVPVCGLGTTLGMLGYGLWHDGLGVRGVVRSWTLLDQARHEATSLAQRTLFAGLSPDALTVAADGLLVAPWACSRAHAGPDRWQFDPASQALDGGVLPSRQATPLVSARHGTARQRLRARLAGERLDLLLDGGVEPDGEVLLRDHDGRYWLGTGVLAPVDAAAAAAALDRWQRAAARLTPVLGAEGGATVAHHVVHRLLGGRELPPGAYVARTARAPWLDEHGLRPAYDRAEHFVVGRLAVEDLGR